MLKPVRHITRVAELTAAEVAVQGALIHRCTIIIEKLLSPAQTYVCLSSHAGGQPVHIHYVLQPVTSAQMANGRFGPRLQADMFAARQRPHVPDAGEVERLVDQARRLMNGG